MRTIWFKQRFVGPILSGEKTDTVRQIGKQPPPRVGELVGLAVGPRPAFAAAVVTAVEEVDAGELDPGRRGDVAGMCGEARRYRRITFRLLRPPLKDAALPAAAAGR